MVDFNVRRVKRKTKDWEKIFAKDTSDKELLSKIHTNIHFLPFSHSSSFPLSSSLPLSPSPTQNSTRGKQRILKMDPRP